MFIFEGPLFGKRCSASDNKYFLFRYKTVFYLIWFTRLWFSPNHWYFCRTQLFVSKRAKTLNVGTLLFNRMETESDRPAHVSQKAKNNVIQVIPISMSTAFFKMTIESDPTMATLPDKICTTDFINYLIQFKRTSDINQCQYISK